MIQILTIAFLIFSLLIFSNTVQSVESAATEVAHNQQFEKVKLISRGRLINVIDFIEPHKYTVFMFYADWCAPCVPLKEKLGELAVRVNNMALREIDIINLENPLVKYYNLPSVPFFIIYGPDGNFLERGPMLSKELLKQIASENQ